MTFALLTDESYLAWKDGTLTGTPPWAVSEAEDALREREWAGATPTGPWFERGTPEHAWLVLRGLEPQAEVGGEPPTLGDYGPELPGQEPQRNLAGEGDAPTERPSALSEAVAVHPRGGVAFDPHLHPRDRLGRWRDALGFKKLIPKLPHLTTPTERPLAEVFSSEHDAQEWWQKKYPDKHFDLTGADMETLGPALVQFARLADKHPYAFKESAGIVIDRPDEDADKADHLSPDAHAGIRRKDGMLLLSPISWTNPDEQLYPDLEAAELAGWHPPGVSTPAGLLTHEFAHLLDRALDKPAEVTSQPTMGATKMAFRESYGTDYGTVAAVWHVWKKDSDKLPVSGYAVASGGRDDLFRIGNGERIAEAFASIYHTPDELKDEYVQRLEKLLDEIADESKWIPATNDRSISFEGDRGAGRGRVTETEYNRFQEERREWMAQMMGPLWTTRQPNAHPLYEKFYGGDQRQAEISALYARRHEVEAHLRGVQADKKRYEAQRWIERRAELKAQGLSVREQNKQMTEEGWTDPLVRGITRSLGDQFGA